MLAIAMVSNEIDSIEELFSDAQPVDEKAAVRALRAFITIQREGRDIYFRNTQHLTSDDAVLAYGLAKKLLKMKGLVEQESISANEVHKKTGIKKGTVDPAFKRLRKQGLLVGAGTSYEIPNYKADEVVKRLLSKSKKGGE